jgi:hypothetical protein
VLLEQSKHISLFDIISQLFCIFEAQSIIKSGFTITIIVKENHKIHATASPVKTKFQSRKSNNNIGEFQRFRLLNLNQNHHLQLTKECFCCKLAIYR